MDPFLGKIASGVANKGTQPNNLPIGGDKPGESPFAQLMNDMGSQQDLTKSLGINPADMSTEKSGFKAITAEGIDPIPANLEVGSIETSPADFVGDLLGDMNRGQNNMEGMLSDMLYSGREMSMQELLAVEARIFYYTQYFEMGVKAASESVSSFRQILNQQVQ